MKNPTKRFERFRYAHKYIIPTICIGKMQYGATRTNDVMSEWDTIEFMWWNKSVCFRYNKKTIK